jgi:hypothetical protein
MFRKLISSAVVVLMTTTYFVQPAQAAGANVNITASVASNGTTTLVYRATALRAGTLRDIVMSIPSGSTGQVTSVNGTVTTVKPGVLRWRPSKTVTVAVGARFSIPLYGLKVPTGPWTLGFTATGTAGQILTSGTGALTWTASVRITASNPIPGQKTTLTYAATVTRAGTLASVRMQLPARSTGAVTSVNGTLTTSSGYATWTARTPINVKIGARLSIPIYGLVLSKYGGIMTLAVSARTSGGTILSSGSGTIALIAPPAPMPAVSAPASAAIPPGCPSSWPTTTAENAKPGTGNWVIPASMSGPLAAYLTKVSATCGDTVDLKVTSGNRVTVIAYRMGYYQGLGAREIWRQEGVPTVVQPAPITGGSAGGHTLHMTSAANWTKTLTIPVDKNWVPGTYLIKVSDGRYASYAPLTVRNDLGTKHSLMIVQATTTWQAYNWYGGLSFYTSPTGSGRLTFDRPYAEGQGSGQFLPLEQGLVFWAESKGIDAIYWTDNDLDRLGGGLASRAGTLFLPGHDEYYSLRMRASISQAISRGINVASLGANAVYRKIAFTDESRRYWDIDRYTDGFNSTLWRYYGDAYASQPLLGAEYVCGLWGSTLTTGTSWLFAGITPGTAVPGFIAGELDNVWPGLYKHPGQTTIASGTGTCRRSGNGVPMHTTTYTAPSGARVLNGSTFAYGCFLVSHCPSTWTVPTPSAASRRIVATMVANLTEWVSRGTIVVPGNTLAADMRAAVPHYELRTNTQP